MHDGLQSNVEQLGQWFTDQAEWTAMADQHLLSCIRNNDLPGLMRWTEKLKKENPRAWVLYMCEHWNEMNPHMKDLYMDQVVCNYGDRNQ